MTLSELFERGKDRGKFNRIPHISIWWDEKIGWRASCAGVMSNAGKRHDTPEDALESAFDNATYLSQRLKGGANGGKGNGGKDMEAEGEDGGSDSGDGAPAG